MIFAPERKWSGPGVWLAVLAECGHRLVSPASLGLRVAESSPPPKYYPMSRPAALAMASPANAATAGAVALPRRVPASGERSIRIFVS